MTATFDASQFLNMTFEESNSTATVPVPVGEYNSLIEKVDIVPWQSRDGSSSGIKLQVIHNLDDAQLREFLGRDKVSVRQEIMIDLNEGGMIDFGKGKNVQLGRLREACNLNVSGQPFSFPQFVGRLVKASIKHRVVEDKIYAEVKDVARL